MKKRDEILHVTYLLFSELGYGLSLSQVTGRMGLKKQSIYNYFESKDKLITEMLIWKISEYYDGLMSVVHATRRDMPDQRLNTIMDYSIQYFLNPVNLGLRRWLVISDIYKGIGEVYNLVETYENRFLDQLRIIIKEAMDIGLILNENIEDVLFSFLVLVQGMIDGMFVYTKQRKPEVLIQSIIKKFWKMMQ